jgi:hypothetical protein
MPEGELRKDGPVPAWRCAGAATSQTGNERKQPVGWVGTGPTYPNCPPSPPTGRWQQMLRHPHHLVHKTASLPPHCCRGRPQQAHGQNMGSRRHATLPAQTRTHGVRAAVHAGYTPWLHSRPAMAPPPTWAPPRHHSPGRRWAPHAVPHPRAERRRGATEPHTHLTTTSPLRQRQTRHWRRHTQPTARVFHTPAPPQYKNVQARCGRSHGGTGPL